MEKPTILTHYSASMNMVGRFSSINCSFQVLPNHPYWTQVRTLIRPLKTLIVFWIIVYITQLLFSFSYWTDYQTFSLRMFWYRAEFMIPSKLSRSQGSKVPTHHHINITMCDVLYNILTGKYCICLTPDIIGLYHSKRPTFDFCVHRTLKGLWITQVFFCNSEMCIDVSHGWQC